MTTQSTKKIAEALKEKGLSVEEWADRKGYKRSYVYRVILRWIEDSERRGRLPHGGIGRQIFCDLRRDLGPEIVPLHQPADTQAA